MKVTIRYRCLNCRKRSEAKLGVWGLDTQGLFLLTTKIFLLISVLVFFASCAGNPGVRVAKASPQEPSSFLEPQSVSITPIPEYSIRINLPERRLYLKDHGKLVKSYPIAIGQGRYPTPVRGFYIHQIVWNPWWIPPPSGWAKNASKTPPGPRNPLGPVKMIMQEAFLIHGTNTPSSIGHAASHGCIRMHKEDAKDLAWILQSGYSSKKDEKLRDLYNRNSKKSFWVSLDRPIPVSTTYDTVEVMGEHLVLYQDIYGKKGDLKRQIELALTSSGHEGVLVKNDVVQNIKKMLRKGRVILPISEVTYESRVTSL